MWGGGVAIVNGVIGAGIIKKVTFEQRLERIGRVLCRYLGEAYCG